MWLTSALNSPCFRTCSKIILETGTSWRVTSEGLCTISIHSDILLRINQSSGFLFKNCFFFLRHVLIERRVICAPSIPPDQPESLSPTPAHAVSVPVGCAQTWGTMEVTRHDDPGRVHAQWTWALPQTPHRPAGWRHVTLQPPGQTKVAFAQQFCSAGAGPAPFTKRLNGSRDTGRRCVVTRQRNVWGWRRFIHACGILLFDVQGIFILTLGESAAEFAFERRDSQLQVELRINSNSVSSLKWI